MVEYHIATADETTGADGTSPSSDDTDNNTIASLFTAITDVPYIHQSRITRKVRPTQTDTCTARSLCPSGG